MGVPPATSDWTVTQISQNQTEKHNEKNSSNHNRKKRKN